MRLRYILVLVAAVGLAAGCRSTRQAAATAAPEGAPKPQEAPRRELTVTTFTAMVNGISATGQVRMAEDSVIWLSVTKLVELQLGLRSPSRTANVTCRWCRLRPDCDVAASDAGDGMDPFVEEL
jgi:hypothetical protein